MHDRDGKPELGIATCLVGPEPRPAWGRSPATGTGRGDDRGRVGRPGRRPRRRRHAARVTTRTRARRRRSHRWRCRSSSTATPATTTRSRSSSRPRHTELLGVTTVAGNAPLERTTRNALVMLDLLGHRRRRSTSGAARPLRRPRPSTPATCTARAGWTAPTSPSPSAAVAGEDAVEPSSSRPPAPREGVWLVPTGPLTNIALALRRAPDLPRPHRRHLADGRQRHGRQPHRGGRVQHLGRPRRPRPSSSTTADR